MKTLFSMGLLVVFGIIANFATVFVLNVAGLPGSLLAGKPIRRSKGQFVVGTIISGVGQLYLYLAYVAFIVSWTVVAANRDDVVGFILWPIAFFSVFLPIWMNLVRARVESREMEHANAQTEALHLTFLVSVIGFFVFVFLPIIMKVLYGWVPYVSE